jgi:hypothetical protein
MGRSDESARDALKCRPCPSDTYNKSDDKTHGNRGLKNLNRDPFRPPGETGEKEIL